MRWMALLLFAASAQPMLGCVTNVIPFGVTTNHLIGKTIGDAFVVNSGSGEGGKIDLRGYQTVGDWSADMVALGCSCEVCDGPYPVLTGFAGVSAAFNAMGVGSVFIMPLVDSFSSGGNGVTADIVGFVFVQLLSSSGSGSNWSATLQLLTAPLPPNDLTADSDGDGMSDYAEFYAGTSPTDNASAFKITSVTREGDDLHISWTTVAGKTYNLERGDGFTNFVGIFPVSNASGATTNFLDVGATTNTAAQFYRVRLIP